MQQHPTAAMALAVGFTDNSVELYVFQLQSVPALVSVAEQRSNEAQIVRPVAMMRVRSLHLVRFQE